MGDKMEKQSERRIYITFAGVLVGSFLIGVLMGTGIAALKGTLGGLEQLWSRIKQLAVYVMPVVFAGYNAVLFALSMHIYHKNRRLAELWDGEDEAVIERIEQQLNFPMLFASISMILNYMFFVILVELAEFTELSKAASGVVMALNIVIFVLGFAWYIVVAKLVVDLEKRLNPEKRGNVLDLKFTKRWEESCDEAEKQVIGQCAYKAFRVTNTTCMILWLIAFISEFTFHTGVFPVVCICAIWMVQNVSFIGTAMKLER
jgi:hypothetical protein